MKRILVVGNADSIYIKSVIEKTMLSFNDKVSILSPHNNIYSDYYKLNKIRIYSDRKSNRGIWFLSTIRNLFVFKKKFDVICFHYIDLSALVMLPIARLYSRRIVVSYWGSDILRINKKSFINKAITVFLTNVSLLFADRITFITSSMIKEFHQLCGTKYDKKINKVDFGLDIIEELKDIIFEEKRIRKKYDINYSKIVISIGYNNNPNQQHIRVLNCIKKYPKCIKEKIHIIIRLTYGQGSNQYIEKIKKISNSIGCTVSLFETYLTNKEIAEITSITDIFIHAQTTDAQSASICEHLFAKCLVLNPKWIRYDELEKSVFYLKYDDFEEMHKILLENICKKNESKYLNELDANSQKIYEMCSWKKHTPEWRSVYFD